jgi:hypothetical protein
VLLVQQHSPLQQKQLQQQQRRQHQQQHPKQGIQHSTTTQQV